MSPSEFFAFLGAPLKNVRWSWGAVRSSDGAVFLRVWQDGNERIDGQRFMHISSPRDAGDDDNNPGYRERLEHAELVRQGARCYLIMCVARDTHAVPRQIDTFNSSEVFRGGRVANKGNSIYIELKDRVSAVSVRQGLDT